MDNLPDCPYEYRYERPHAHIVDTCSVCGDNILEGDDYYTIQGLTICDQCINEYKHIAEVVEE